MNQWNGRTVLVTGAGRGLGLALARGWLACGAEVIAHTGRNETDLQDARKRLTQGITCATTRVTCYAADAAVPGRMGALFAHILETTPNLDAVLFNHGSTTFDPQNDEEILIAPPHTYSPEQMQELVQINAMSVWEGLHQLARVWALERQIEENRRRKRAIALISSSGAVNPYVFDPMPYKVSKSMLLHFVRDLAQELARFGISINAVSPGMMDSGLSHLPFVAAMKEHILDGIPMKRYGTEDELFNLVNMLLSGQAAFSTGNNITMNGGAYVPGF